jgi:hypothetical protein
MPDDSASLSSYGKYSILADKESPQAVVEPGEMAPEKKGEALPRKAALGDDQASASDAGGPWIDVKRRPEKSVAGQQEVAVSSDGGEQTVAEQQEVAVPSNGEEQGATGQQEVAVPNSGEEQRRAERQQLEDMKLQQGLKSETWAEQEEVPEGVPRSREVPRDAAWDGLGNTVLTVTPEMQAEEIDRRLEQRAEARVVSELRALIEKGRKAAKAPESRVPSRPTQWQFTPSKQVLPDSLIGKFTEDVRGLLVNARNRDCHQWDWMMWADTFIDELRQVAVDLEKKNADVGLELQAYKTVLTLPEVLESKLDEMEKALQAFRAAMAEANTSGKLSEEVRPMLARAWTEDKEMKVSEELLGLYQELWSLIQETPRRRGEKAYPNLADMESFHRWQMDHATSSREPLSTRQPIGWVTKKKVPVVNQQHDYWRGRELVRWLRNERAYLDPTSPWFDALQDTDAALYIGHPCGVEQKMGYFGGIDDEYDARPAPKWWSSNLPLLPPELAEAHGTEE